MQNSSSEEVHLLQRLQDIYLGHTQSSKSVTVTWAETYSGFIVILNNSLPIYTNSPISKASSTSLITLITFKRQTGYYNLEDVLRESSLARCSTISRRDIYMLTTRQAAAPQPRQVEVTEAEPATTSLIDVDSPHVSSVPPTYESQRVKTNTQAERIEREHEEKKRREEAETEAKRHAARHSKGKAKATKNKAVAAKSCLARNKSNPVVLGNALLIAVAGAGLGFGAYQKHAQGSLTWRVVGVWSGAVGAVGAVDYFVSK
ncbi:uncharacterized protein BDCG_02520 [Blastomyces dermatitidis ER-3]|uniref:Mitochondrial outer membrane protein OM14 C-terminal domain-containing protein n=1 Tax=Ajellomyces dermatitidis (strain ER-3 / ATCC MYA-2586) TaxID=559297 RepID=A0ABP2EWL3_AJEDR|nr:uncharacterized protein BDCG_02520 [Blastomyces dermatitidis ER-3]EEQ87400.2 hypothetical protein BDCG_02520 [Blastomyces dermatitidis ER-3]